MSERRTSAHAKVVRLAILAVAAIFYLNLLYVCYEAATIEAAILELVVVICISILMAKQIKPHQRIDARFGFWPTLCVLAVFWPAYLVAARLIGMIEEIPRQEALASLPFLN